ncbi:hypothetical protein B0H17DRAFT_1082778 [Mycena rosella]|uniref:Uncharacterized protein n=1 Tax=Mycena rosella TaxID=1033263 RepID=A0AAD7D1J6_MYCRO|nr:hypothetical protein B0H17DRAFT_1082778 [Mycena rosella]
MWEYEPRKERNLRHETSARRTFRRPRSPSSSSTPPNTLTDRKAAKKEEKSATRRRERQNTSHVPGAQLLLSGRLGREYKGVGGRVEEKRRSGRKERASSPSAPFYTALA